MTEAVLELEAISSRSPPQELFEAVKANNLAEIGRLINESPSLLDYVYESHNRTIFLIACSEDGVQAKVVQKLLKLGANCRDCRSDNGWEAIHFAAERSNFEVLDVLISYDSSCVNALEKYGNNALHCLIRYGAHTSDQFLKCADLLIRNGIDGTQKNSKNKTPIELMSYDSYMKQTLINLFQKHNRGNIQAYLDVYRKLLQSIYEKDQEGCIKKISEIADFAQLNDCCPGASSTLLQLCCRNRLCNVVKHLVRNGIDPSRVTEKDKEEPVIIAASRGYSDILDALLKKYEINKIPNNLLGYILRSIDNKELDYMGCYRVLINKYKTFVPKDQRITDEVLLKINGCDEMKNTPLHYAVWYASANIIKELLSLGAFQGAANIYGDRPIKDIDSEILEEHLDNCIVVDSSLNKFEPDFRIKFNIQSLVQPNCRDTVEFDAESPVESRKLTPDTEVISCMAKSPELKHLLTHPVIVSFLTLKWHQYQWLFWANFAFYFVFTMFFLAFIVIDYCKAINAIFIDPTAYSILKFGLTANLALLVFRELFQIFTDPAKYYRRLDNYMELLLISLTFIVLSGVLSSPNSKRQLWSVSILLLSFELIVMVGKHPYFSTHVVMLKTVSFNFFRSFLSYSLLIVAFAFCFHILFNTNIQVTKIGENANNGTDEFNEGSFNNIGRSVFKTIVMLTGEFDSSSIDFETFFVISKLIFVFFIFMIHLILLNLLNGLAVSDTQKIRDEAEVIGHTARIEYIRNVEDIMTNQNFRFNFFNKLIRICFYFANNTVRFKYQPTVDHRSPKFGQYELTFYPNKNEFSCDSSNSHICCSKCLRVCLSKDTIKRIHSIIQKRYRRHGGRYEHCPREPSD